MRSVISFFKKYPLFFLIISIVITAVIIYHKYIFCGYIFFFDDAGSDTKQQYIMQYNSIVNHLRTGNISLWDMTNGFGTSLYQLTLFNPLLWILYIGGIIFSPSIMPLMLIYVHIAGIVCSGIAIWHFLSVFSFSKKAKLLAAYAYAFNGFITLWGQHYAFTAIMIYFPLLLAALEKALRRKRFSPAVAIVAGLMILCTYYFSFMALIAAAVYVLIRLWTLRPGGAKHYFLTLLKQLAAVLIGAGIGLVNLLPSYFMVTNVSSRISGDSPGIIANISMALRAWPKDYYKTLAMRFLSSGLQGNSSSAPYSGYSNYYEAPNVFFTSLLIIVLVQLIIFVIVRKYDIRIKIASVIAIVLGVAVLGIPAGSLPFNFFAYPFSRHTFILMPFFALAVAFIADRMIKERFFSIIGAVISVAGCIYVYRIAIRDSTANNTFILAVALMACTIGLAFFLILYSKGPGKIRFASFALICAALAAQVGLDGTSTVLGRETIRSDDPYFEDLYGSNYTALQKYLQERDDDLYRIEKDYTIGSHCMDSLAQDYHGISTYNSTMNAHILDFSEKLVPEINYVNHAHISFVQAADKQDLHDLFGIKYIISKDPEISYEGYALEKQFGDIYLYRNTRWQGFSSFYTETASYEDFEKIRSEGRLINNSELLSDVLLLENSKNPADLYVYEKHPLSDLCFDNALLPEKVSVNEDGSYTWMTDSLTELPLSRVITTEGKNISVSFKLSSDRALDIIIYADKDGAGRLASVAPGQSADVNLEIPNGAKGIWLSFPVDDVPVQISDVTFYESVNTSHVQNAEIRIRDNGNDGMFTAEAAIYEDGYMFIPIPFEEGWIYEADGVRVYPVSADYGFTAIPLKSGIHTVNFRYEQPHFRLSLYGSFASVIICIISGIAAAFIRRRRDRAGI